MHPEKTLNDQHSYGLSIAAATMSISHGESQLLPKPYARRRTLSVFSPLSAGTSRNSSMSGIWAEDYYDPQSLESRGRPLGNKEELSLALPEPATLSSRQSPPSDSECREESSQGQTRTHQRSLTYLLPFGARSRGNSTSPDRISPGKAETPRELVEDFMPTLSGEGDGVVRIEGKQRGGLSSWFSGTSAPISLGIPVTEHETRPPFNESQLEVSPQQETAKLRKRPNIPSVESTGSNASSNMVLTKTPTSAAPGRFNFFSQKVPPKQIIKLPEHMIEDDELLTLDIHAALFPYSSKTQDISPSSFKDLLMNAEGLLLRLQTAYKLRTVSLHDVNAEKEAQDEELEEAETRTQCLKAQLQEMSNRVTEQDRVVEELVEQLVTEKQARVEERLAREKSISLIRASHERSLSEAEDLVVSKKHRPRAWRKSGGSTTTECDSDAELGSPTDSIFSRSRSPAPTITSMLSSATCTSADTTPEILQASFARVVSLQQQQRPTTVQQPSTFQKILQGISPSTSMESGCENCRGGNASMAWDTVSLLRAENKGLKERIGSLEGAVETALDLCSNMGRY
jgi:hypothetical protein